MSCIKGYSPVNLGRAKNVGRKVVDFGIQNSSGRKAINYIAMSKIKPYKAGMESNSFLNKTCKISDVVDFVMTAVEMKHDQTAKHMKATSMYAKALANELHLPKKKQDEIEVGALLHDTGKMMMDSKFFKKEEGLTVEQIDREFEKHPVTGLKLLKNINPFKGTVTNIVGKHHEKYFGGGFPVGIKGEKIPLETQITTFADVFDSLTRKKYPDSVAKTPQKAVQIIKENDRGQFKPDLINSFVNVITKNNFELFNKAQSL